MKLIAQLKLLPTPEQAEALRGTIQQANLACAFVNRQAWRTQTFKQFALHRLCYDAVRARFGLSAQVTVRVIAKVADAYTLDREGETDLTWVGGNFLLAATCEAAEAPRLEAQDALGVDLGITNIAVDSDGEVHSSQAINAVRHRQRRLRAKLQRKGTRAARGRLRRLAGKEARFAKDTNHRISKQLVAKAQGTKRAIALEDLQGIRARVTARRSQRATLHSWSFAQLRGFVEYKARRAGVPVVLVDPRNTSRTCPRCGCVDARNRTSQSQFSCVVCSFAGLADHVAAHDWACARPQFGHDARTPSHIRRAAVNPPHVSRPAVVSDREGQGQATCF
jgi:putative transposase